MPDPIRAALREAERAMVASNKHDLVMAAATVAAFLRALPDVWLDMNEVIATVERAARGGEDWKAWSERMARLEGNEEIGAGALSAWPDMQAPDPRDDRIAALEAEVARLRALQPAVWAAVKAARDESALAAQLHTELSALLTRMQQAGMASHLPRVEDVIDPDFTGGLPVQEYLRKLRGDDDGAGLGERVA